MVLSLHIQVSKGPSSPQEQMQLWRPRVGCGWPHMSAACRNPPVMETERETLKRHLRYNKTMVITLGGCQNKKINDSFMLKCRQPHVK